METATKKTLSCLHLDFFEACRFGEYGLQLSFVTCLAPALAKALPELRQPSKDEYWQVRETAAKGLYIYVTEM